MSGMSLKKKKKWKKKYSTRSISKRCKFCHRIKSQYVNDLEELNSITKFCNCFKELPFHFEIPKDENLSEENYTRIYDKSIGYNSCL